MEKLTDTQIENTIDIARKLERAASHLPILRSVNWGADVKVTFLKTGALPKPVYADVDTQPAREILSDMALPTGDHPVFKWLGRTAQTLQRTADLLDSRGSAEFFTVSAKLFGAPDDVMLDGTTKVIDLAEHMDGIFADISVDNLNLGAADEQFDAQGFADRLQPSLRRYFGDDLPAVKVVDSLSAA